MHGNWHFRVFSSCFLFFFVFFANKNDPGRGGKKRRHCEDKTGEEKKKKKSYEPAARSHRHAMTQPSPLAHMRWACQSGSQINTCPFGAWHYSARWVGRWEEGSNHTSSWHTGRKKKNQRQQAAPRIRPVLILNYFFFFLLKFLHTSPSNTRRLWIKRRGQNLFRFQKQRPSLQLHQYANNQNHSPSEHIALLAQTDEEIWNIQSDVWKLVSRKWTQPRA